MILKAARLQKYNDKLSNERAHLCILFITFPNTKMYRCCLQIAKYFQNDSSHFVKILMNLSVQKTKKSCFLKNLNFYNLLSCLLWFCLFAFDIIFHLVAKWQFKLNALNMFAQLQTLVNDMLSLILFDTNPVNWNMKIHLFFQ